MKKIAVFFPGIGYTNDRPLLYYMQRMLAGKGYETVPVNYTGFESGIKGNPEKMREAFLLGLSQTEEILSGAGLETYDDIVFVSKSIGTAVAAKYAADHGLKTRNIYMTPLAFTFMEGMNGGIAFTGTADPWVETGVIKENCERYGIPLTVIKDGNHSLETKNVFTNIDIVKVVIDRSAEYLGLH